MLESGPINGRKALIWPEAGHCAVKHYHDWAPASFAWLAKKL